LQTWNLYPAVFVAVFGMFILIFSLFNPANPDVAEQPGDGASVGRFHGVEAQEPIMD